MYTQIQQLNGSKAATPNYKKCLICTFQLSSSPKKEGTRCAWNYSSRHKCYMNGNDRALIGHQESGIKVQTWADSRSVPHVSPCVKGVKTQTLVEL